MICNRCGKQLLPNEVVCPSCGFNNFLNTSDDDIPVNNDVLINNISVNNVRDNNSSNNDVTFNMNEEKVNSNQNVINTNVSIDNDDIPVNVNELIPDNNNVSKKLLNSNKKNNNKRKLIIISSIVAVLVLLVIILLVINSFSKKEEEDNRKLIENTYSMYVKINPLVKLNVKEKYYECKNESTGKYEKCTEVTDEIISYNLVNNDAKKIYKHLDLKTKNVVEALVSLYDTARENKIEFTDVEITTNWDNRYDNSELVDAIKKNSKYSEEFKIVLDVEKGIITTETILDKYGIEEAIEITYTVTFNSDGGSEVQLQEIKENKKVVKPAVPTKEGYNFIEWQLDGIAYDFESIVESDFELKAKWEKIVVEEEKPKDEEKPNEEPIKEEEKPKEETPKEEEKVEPPKEESPKEEETPKEEESKQEEIPKEEPKEEKPKEEETPKEEPKEEVNQESSINKINLNDNIMVQVNYRGLGFGSENIGYVFSKNLEEVFNIDFGDGGRVIESSFIRDFDEKYSKLQFDSTKEQQTVLTLKDMSAKLPKGVGEFQHSMNSNHMINYQIKYLMISDEMSEKIPVLKNDFNNSLSSFVDKVNALFKDAVFIIPGGMGRGPGEPELLTEELCEEYNLICDRW